MTASHSSASFPRVFVLAVLSLLAIAFPIQAGWASEPPLRLQLAQVPASTAGKLVTVQGRITVYEGQRLGVATASGEVWVRLNEPLGVVGMEAAKFSDIVLGTYLGTTAVKQADGTLRALEVHIFAEAERGLSEGHKPHSRIPNATMTNANVDNVVKKVDGPLMTLKYKGGEVKVFVPPDAPTVKRTAGDRGLLKPGAAVTIRALKAPDGSISSSQVTVGLDGFTPPM
ncbi:MAG: hypothetical protein HYY46_14295 [Deltaproteobacteria bacterium]|nr:hypothetical protein [Deltaproteobacteria bacterium]